MTRALLAAVVVTWLAAQLLAGAGLDLGASLQPAALSLLLAGLGAGWIIGSRLEVGRARAPWRAGLALAALVPLRGPLADAMLALLPATAGGRGFAAAVSLLPAAAVLGALARPVVAPGGPVASLFGVVLGGVGVAAGAVGWLPAPWLGLLGAVVLVALGPQALARRSAAGAPGAATSRSGAASPHPAPGRTHGVPLALVLGLATGLLVSGAVRLLPALVTPSHHAALDVAGWLLLPAAVVAGLARVLVAEGRGRRLLGALGMAALALATMRLADVLSIYENSVAFVTLTRGLHAQAVAMPLVGRAPDWLAWGASFLVLPGVALGLAVGALGGRELGAALLGAGLGLAGAYAVVPRPADGPLGSLLVAAGIALAAAPLALFGWRGVVALPLALLAFLDWHDATGNGPWAWRPIPGFDEVRRPGEFGVDAFERSLCADVTVTMVAPGPISAAEGRAAAALALTPRRPEIGLDAQGGIETTFPAAHVHFYDPAGEHAGGDGEPQASTALPTRALALRVAGRPLHAGDTPTGPGGSVTRLVRLFAPRGATLVAGVGAELVAADLAESGRADPVEVASAVPLGRQPALVLLDALEASGWMASRVVAPLGLAGAARAPSREAIVIVPAPESVPGTPELGSEELLARLAGSLAERGRLLAWIDTEGLDARALRARAAAFGAVFGTQCAAFVEPRAFGPPVVLLLGWRTDAGAPTVGELAPAWPLADRAGARVRLAGLEDLAALLLLDGAGLARLATDGPRHARSRPVTPSAFAADGWAAVAALRDPDARLSRVLPGAPEGARDERDLLAGLAWRATYAFDLSELNDTTIEIRPDVDWDAFQREVDCYARAAVADPGNPLLHHALAGLLEPLAVSGDYGRFAAAWEQCRGSELRSWRLALLEAFVRRESLDEAAADAALARAVAWRAEQARD